MEAAGVAAAAFLEAAGVAAVAAVAVMATGVAAAAAALLAAAGVAPFHFPGTTVQRTYLTSYHLVWATLKTIASSAILDL